MKAHSAWLIALALLLMAGCNVPRTLENTQYRRIQRVGLEQHTFSDAQADRMIHAGNTGKQAIMFVHGYGANGPGQYGSVAKELSDEFDLLLPDLLSFGKSTYRGSSFTIDDQVEHLRIMLDSLRETRKVLLVGNSFGGIVCSRFAVKYPERCAGFVVYDSPVQCYTTQYADSLVKALGLASMEHLLSPISPEGFITSFDLLIQDPPRVPKFVLRQLVEAVAPRREEQLSYIRHLREHEDRYNNESLQFKCPVFCIWGSEDVLIPLSTGRCIAQRYRIPNEHFFVIEGGKHAPNVDRTDEFVGIVRSIAAIAFR